MSKYHVTTEDGSVYEVETDEGAPQSEANRALSGTGLSVSEPKAAPIAPRLRGQERNPARDVMAGIGSGAISTGVRTYDAARKGLNSLGPSTGAGAEGGASPSQAGGRGLPAPSPYVEGLTHAPESIAGQVGKTIEQGAEYLIPGARGIRGPLASAGVAGLQSGGDPSAMATAAATHGASEALPGIAAGLRRPSGPPPRPPVTSGTTPGVVKAQTTPKESLIKPSDVIQFPFRPRHTIGKVIERGMNRLGGQSPSPEAATPSPNWAGPPPPPMEAPPPVRPSTQRSPGPIEVPPPVPPPQQTPSPTWRGATPPTPPKVQQGPPSLRAAGPTRGPQLPTKWDAELPKPPATPQTQAGPPTPPAVEPPAGPPPMPKPQGGAATPPPNTITSGSGLSAYDNAPGKFATTDEVAQFAKSNGVSVEEAAKGFAQAGNKVLDRGGLFREIHDPRYGGLGGHPEVKAQFHKIYPNLKSMSEASPAQLATFLRQVVLKQAMGEFAKGGVVAPMGREKVRGMAHRWGPKGRK